MRPQQFNEELRKLVTLAAGGDPNLTKLVVSQMLGYAVGALYGLGEGKNGIHDMVDESLLVSMNLLKSMSQGDA